MTPTSLPPGAVSPERRDELAEARARYALELLQWQAGHRCYARRSGEGLCLHDLRRTRTAAARLRLL